MSNPYRDQSNPDNNNNPYYSPYAHPAGYWTTPAEEEYWATLPAHNHSFRSLPGIRSRELGLPGQWPDRGPQRPQQEGYGAPEGLDPRLRYHNPYTLRPNFEYW
ncbi:hypothetical protein ACN47E_005523 [Coniothyrium glycines]